MQKKIIALAIAAAFAAPVAMADTANVNVYGLMGVSIDSVDSSGADNERRSRISSNNSHLGFKGNEDLGGGLSGIWQLETAIQMDQQRFVNGQSSSATQGGTSLRNSFVGLSSKSMGGLTLGTQESPLKTSTGPLAVFTNTLGDYRSVFTNLSTRSDNSLLYTSPNMGGLVVQAMYGARNEAGNGGNADARMVAMSGSYTNGPLFLTLAYENNSNTQNAFAGNGTGTNEYRCVGGDNAGLSVRGTNTTVALGACNSPLPDVPSTAVSAVVAGPGTANNSGLASATNSNIINARNEVSSNVKAIRAGVGYTIGDIKLGLAYEKNNAEAAADVAAGGTNADPIAAIAAGDKTNDSKAWYVSAAYKLSAKANLMAAYTKRSETLDDAANGATQKTIGAEYVMSKRTSVYALYTRVSNDTNGTTGIGAGTGIATVASEAGGTATGISFGMAHKF